MGNVKSFCEVEDVRQSDMLSMHSHRQEIDFEKELDLSDREYAPSRDLSRQLNLKEKMVGHSSEIFELAKSYYIKNQENEDQREKISNQIGNLREFKKKIKLATENYELVLEAKKEELSFKVELSDIEKKCKNTQLDIKNNTKIMNEQIDILKLVADIAKKSYLETEKSVIQNQVRLETQRAKIVQETTENDIEKSKIEQELLSSKEVLAQVKDNCQSCLEEYGKTIAQLEHQKSTLDEEFDEMTDLINLNKLQVPELKEQIETRKDNNEMLKDLLKDTRQKNTEDKQKELVLYEQLQQDRVNLISEEIGLEIEHEHQMKEWTQKNDKLSKKIESKKLEIDQKKVQKNTPKKEMLFDSESSGGKRKVYKGQSGQLTGFVKTNNKDLDHMLSSTNLIKQSQMTVNDLMVNLFNKRVLIKDQDSEIESTTTSTPEDTPNKLIL